MCGVTWSSVSIATADSEVAISAGGAGKELRLSSASHDAYLTAGADVNIEATANAKIETGGDVTLKSSTGGAEVVVGDSGVVAVSASTCTIAPPVRQRRSHKSHAQCFRPARTSVTSGPRLASPEPEPAPEPEEAAPM